VGESELHVAAVMLARWKLFRYKLKDVRGVWQVVKRGGAVKYAAPATKNSKILNAGGSHDIRPAAIPSVH